MNVKVLGSGCANCQRLAANVRLALDHAGMTAEVEKVEDIAAIMGYGVTATPALVVDERVLVSGRVPSPTQIAALLRGV
ncbi:MAG: thioredoxin family protein [Trueperaceae bacterium]